MGRGRGRGVGAGVALETLSASACACSHWWKGSELDREKERETGERARACV